MGRTFGAGTLVASLLSTAGCVGPPALHDSVLGYDQTVTSLEQEILLLNVARLGSDEPPHFTVTSSIAATCGFETTSTIGGQIFEDRGIDGFSLSLQSRALENPTFSIVPISGQEFTTRILTPINEGVFAFLGVRIELLARLMADGIEMLSPEGSTKAFFYNKVTTPDQFVAFRQMVIHLGSLQSDGLLFISPLTYDEVVLDRTRQQPNTGDIVSATGGGLGWRENDDKTYT